MANIFHFKEFSISPNPADHVLPAVPKIFLPNPADDVRDAPPFTGIEPLAPPPGDQQPIGPFGTVMTFPLRIKNTNAPGEPWLLPIEPLVSISGGNILVRRNVAKAGNLRGTIKERWATDDYSISIEGIFTTVDGRYPAADVRRLREILEARDTIDVICPAFEPMSIRRIVVDKFNFPFTKGEENQIYQIQAYSDDDWQLFIPLKK